MVLKLSALRENEFVRKESGNAFFEHFAIYYVWTLHSSAEKPEIKSGAVNLTVVNCNRLLNTVVYHNKIWNGNWTFSGFL